MADPTPTPKDANGQTTAPAAVPAQEKPADSSKEQTPAAAAAAAAKEEKLSGAELKKRAKAEKAAKRAQEKAAQIAAGGGGPPAAAANKKQEVKQKEQKGGQQQSQQSGGSRTQQQDRPLPLRRRGSQSGPSGGPVKEVKSEKKKKLEEKPVGLFGHLYGQPRRHEIEGAAKEVHPAVLALGLQMSSYVVCGSNARTVAMLMAFKSVGLLILEACRKLLQRC